MPENYNLAWKKDFGNYAWNVDVLAQFWLRNYILLQLQQINKKYYLASYYRYSVVRSNIMAGFD